MGTHLVICELVGTGNGSEPDPVYIDKAFQASIPASTGVFPERANVPATDDMEDGYFGCWIDCSQATLAQFVALGYVKTVIYEDPDGA